MKFTIKKTLFAGVSVVAAASLLTACGGGSSNSGSGSGSGSSADAAATMPAQMTKITLAVNPSAQMAPEYYGVEQGIFKKHNLDVTLVPQTNIATIVSGLASGQLTFGFATTVAAINANVSNIKLVAVGAPDGQQNPNEAPDAGSSLVAGPGTGIKSAGDLSGKTVCVVGTASLNSLAVYALASKAGVKDPVSSIKLLQLPFGQMPQALSAKQCDAAVINAPFISQAEQSGGTVIDKPNVDLFPDMAVGLFFTTQSYIDQNPTVVKAFSDAVVESQLAARKDVAGAQQTLVKQLSISAADAANSVWNTVAPPYPNTGAFTVTQDLMTKYAGLKQTVDVSKLVWPGAEDPKQ